MKTTRKQEAEVVAEPDFSGLTPEQYGALVELELADRARGEGPEAVYAWAELEFGGEAGGVPSRVGGGDICQQAGGDHGAARGGQDNLGDHRHKLDDR